MTDLAAVGSLLEQKDARRWVVYHRDLYFDSCFCLEVFRSQAMLETMGSDRNTNLDETQP